MRFGVKMLATEEQFLIRVGERYPLKMKIQNKILLTNKTLKNFGSLVIRECMHFFTLPEDPVMPRKIKPQRTQRITESCYFFYLSPPLCHSVSSVVFRKPYFENIKKYPGFWSPQREMPKTQNLLENFDVDATDYGIEI
jgi:hypothetical protein